MGRSASQEGDERSGGSSEERKQFRLWGTRGALIGGVVAALVTAAGILAVGRISGYEARILAAAMLPTARFLCSTYMAASATILALMVTVLGISRAHQGERPSARHFQAVREIAFFDCLAFIASTMFLLMLLVVPIEESEHVPLGWFTAIYYSVIVVSSLLGGLLITIVLLLNTTIRGLTEVIEPCEDA